jgi:peptide chain release factor subunit 1
LRLEKRHNYLRKVAELAVQFFITNNVPNVTGLILAGSAEFKNELSTSDLFDPRLKEIVIQTVDVSYGGESGFNQAIELSAEALSSVKLVQEKKLLQDYFEEINRDTGRYCFMVKDTLMALDMGAVETLIVWENLEIDRITVRNQTTDEESQLYLTREQQENETMFRDQNSGAALEVIEKTPLVDWLAENYRSFGARIEFVTNRSQEGSQFVRGFGGIGGILRWQVQFAEFEVFDDFDDDDDFFI